MQERYCSGQVRALKLLSDTRWACCINSINTFHDTMPATLATLIEIESTDQISAIACQARGLRKGIEFEFTFALKIKKYNKNRRSCMTQS